ncbi:ferritin-like fold-containing protein [Propionibacteriaceae bacterium G1746]
MTASADAEAIAGLYACGWLLVHESLAELVGLAPTVSVALEHAQAAGGIVEAAGRARAVLGARADDLTGHTRQAFASVQQHTPAATWPEALLKNHLIVGMGLDLSTRTHATWPEQVSVALAGGPGRDLAAQVQASITGLDLDETTASRTALFGRRVIAELSAQAQRIAGRDTALARALTGAEAGSADEISHTVELIQDLVEGAAQRMLALGLQP